MDEVYKRIPAEELELLSREIELCRDAGGDWEYESFLAESVAARIYTEIEVVFTTYKQSSLYHAFVKCVEGGHVERGHGQSKYSFWTALRYALIGMGMAKIDSEQ